MKVHHLNCGTLCPVAGRLLGSDVGFLERGTLVCHCLLIETNDGLVLVDTGIGLGACRDPRGHLGLAFAAVVMGARGDEAETAARQVERLGFAREDVRHVVVTHLDLDHAGGLPDFPAAEVHVFADEHRAAMARATFGEQSRYRPAQWAHDPRWRLHEVKGERWKGFDSVQALPGVEPEVLLVPLVGHTRGHCAVAVNAGARWLLHCGDAYFWHAEKDPERPGCPWGLSLFQRRMAVDRRSRDQNVERLRELVRDHGAEVDVFCAHDRHELAALATR